MASAEKDRVPPFTSLSTVPSRRLIVPAVMLASPVSASIVPEDENVPSIARALSPVEEISPFATRSPVIITAGPPELP